MIYVQRIPAAPLDAFVASIWFFHSEPRPFALERILPSGSPQLIVNLKEDATRAYRPEAGFRCESTSGTILAGVQTQYGVIDTAEQECVVGVSFKAGGLTPFIGMPVHETRDVDVPLDVLWGRSGAALRERLLEAESPAGKLDVMERVLREIWRPRAPHPAVRYALGAFQECPVEASIGAVTEKIGLSPKRFIESFKSAVGITPKRFCRILRFQRALTCAQGGGRVDWTDVALECGYFDQAHFIHDFRSFAGITPTGYESSRTQFQNHVKFLQSPVEMA